MQHTHIAVALLLMAPPLLAQAPAAPQPGPEVKKLEYFAGRWTSTSDFKPGAMGPGGKGSATSNCEWFAGGFYLVCRAEGTTPMGANQSLAILGYNPERKQYTYYAIDNSGMPADVVHGTLTGDTWLWEGEGTMGGQPVKGRYTIKVVSPEESTWTWEMQMGNGPWTTVATGTDKKAK